MAAKPVKVAFIADTAELKSSLGKAEAAMDSAGATATKAGSKIDSAFETTAGHADNVASKGAQAAGALSGLGGLVGGQFGSAMLAGGVAMQAFADAGDLVNVVTESGIVLKAKDKVATIGKAVVDKAAAAGSKAMAAAQWLVNAAMEANPIGLVVVAIAALVAGLVLAYKKSDTFRAIVQAAFRAVENVVKPVISWFAKAIPAAFKFVVDAVKKYISVYKTVVTTAFNLVKGAVTGAMNAIKSVVSRVWNGVTSIIQNGADAVVNAVKAVPGKLLALAGKFGSVGKSIITAFINGLKGGGSFVSDIAGNVWNALRGMINGAIDKINGALHFSFNTHIPGIGTVSVDPPDIPHLAAGGIVTRPTVALIGEAGPEAVIPLSKASTTQKTSAAAGMADQRVLDALTKLTRAVEKQGAEFGKQLNHAAVKGYRNR